MKARFKSNRGMLTWQIKSILVWRWEFFVFFYYIWLFTIHLFHDSWSWNRELLQNKEGWLNLSSTAEADVIPLNVYYYSILNMKFEQNTNARLLAQYSVFIVLMWLKSNFMYSNKENCDNSDMSLRNLPFSGGIPANK